MLRLHDDASLMLNSASRRKRLHVAGSATGSLIARPTRTRRRDGCSTVSMVASTPVPPHVGVCWSHNHVRAASVAGIYTFIGSSAGSTNGSTTPTTGSPATAGAVGFVLVIMATFVVCDCRCCGTRTRLRRCGSHRCPGPAAVLCL